MLGHGLESSGDDALISRVTLKMGNLVIGKEIYLAVFYLWVGLALQRTKSHSGSLLLQGQ